MDGGDLVYPLPFITVVADTLRVSVLLQTLVAELRPCLPPFLGFSLLVPVLRLLVSAIIKNIFTVNF